MGLNARNWDKSETKYDRELLYTEGEIRYFVYTCYSTGNVMFSNNVTLTYIASLGCIFIKD